MKMRPVWKGMTSSGVGLLGCSRLCPEAEAQPLEDAHIWRGRAGGERGHGQGLLLPHSDSEDSPPTAACRPLGCD